MKMNMMKPYVVLINFGFGSKPSFSFLMISKRKKTYIQEGIQATREASSTYKEHLAFQAKSFFSVFNNLTSGILTSDRVQP
jgi:hypothetical protein